VGVTPRSVHDERAAVLADCFGKGFRPILNNDVPPATLTGQSGVEGWSIRVVAILECGDDNVALETGFTLHKVMRKKRCENGLRKGYYGLALDGAAVDGDISEVRKELLGTVLRLDKLEQLRRIVNEL
jgi:hypothetical protein